MRDYDGDMSFYQDQLEKKGITKEQLDMRNYVGLSRQELQAIVNNPKAFIRKSYNDIWSDLMAIDTNIPEGFTEESYADTINYCLIFPYNNMDSKDSLYVFRFIKTHDLNEVRNVINHVMSEYSSYEGGQTFGRHSFWDNKLYEDHDFKAFSIIAEHTIPSDIFHEHHFQKMLLEEYNKKLV